MKLAKIESLPMPQNAPYSYISLDDDLDLTDQNHEMTAQEEMIMDKKIEEPAKKYGRADNQPDDSKPKKTSTEDLIASYQTEEEKSADSSGAKHSEMTRDDGEMSNLEEKMLEVAIEDYNVQRQKAHAEVDRVYDKMIKIASEKIQGLAQDIATEAGM